MRSSPPLCQRCGRVARYRFAGGARVPILLCARHAVVYGPVIRKALEVSAVVGSILFVINQLNVVLAGGLSAVVSIKIVLTYLVPYLVSTYSALEINRLPVAASVERRPSATTPGAAA